MAIFCERSLRAHHCVFYQTTKSCLLFSTNQDCRIPLAIFISVALYSVIPIAHWSWLQGGLHMPVVQDKLKQIVIPFIAGGVGLIFYVTRFPEKLFKAGSVDIFGASHQVCETSTFTVT